MKTKITLSFARLLNLLSDGEVNYAEFTSGNRKLLEQFLKDGALDYRVIGNQQKKIFCSDAANLTSYLQNKFEIPVLTGYIEFLERDEFQRSDAVLAASDSKIRKAKVFSGFLVNGYEDIVCELFGEPFHVKPSKGIFTFVSAYQNFKIPEDVTVVVVEGHENFREIERQRYLFERIRPLFLWRYVNSNAIAEWLSSVKNPYIHFGDFDLKGVHIYLAEFKNKIAGNRGRFLMPADLEVLLNEFGEKELYEKQKSLLPAIDAHDEPDIKSLVELIRKYKKGLAQEIFISVRDKKNYE